MINTSQQLITHLKVHRNWEWWRLVESCEKVELPHAVRACVFFNTLYFQRNNVGYWTLVVTNRITLRTDCITENVYDNCTWCSLELFNNGLFRLFRSLSELIKNVKTRMSSFIWSRLTYYQEYIRICPQGIR